MSKNTFRLTSVWALLFVSLLVACDSFQEDVIPGEKVVTVDPLRTNYYVLENSSAIICKSALVKSSFANVSIDVARHPRRGTVSALGDLFLKYTPSPELREKLRDYYLVSDEFELAFKSNEDVLATQPITIYLGWRADYFPCSLYAMGDTASTRSGVPIAIRAAFNDRVCNIRMDDITTSISLDPRHGKAMVHGDTIIYTPETGFQGVDEMIYCMTTPVVPHSQKGDSLLVSYGLITITVRE